ncbi:acyl-CoA thioesterase II [Demequina sp. SYSU T00039]|uniref:Acyl-CoA thioesterase II n=1 Tax=Demequina lignilytica TaxID=3051663 RepID=A0AAW7M8P8_9MICO|nr:MULTISPECIES: acyl-CoA thioesterase II [unclassified Demequina]MDN4479268.1 acyl-CoA thioesterase II [Demequina sp. SYSU T00039-1]MDN4487586.1 acyl-CoA thioesterase II [Demequina sp. SYSU T00039]
MERVEDIWADAAVASGMAALDLRRLGDTSFEGDSLPMPRGRVFGGQVLAQSLLAAGATVAEDRFAHSLHGYFLRAGDATQPIQFEVEILRDGGSFSARRTHALQNGKPILSLIASFQLEQEGPEHAAPMPAVPGPEEAASGVDIMAPFAGHPSADFWLTKAPFDVRHLDGSLFLGPDAEPKSTQMAWMRVRRPIDAPDLMHRALLAFGSDQVMLEPLLRRHGASWVTPGVAVASLDHAMWWYRPARADEWLLFVQEAPNARGGRGLTAARIYAQDGTLVASAAQEGMIRM